MTRILLDVRGLSLSNICLMIVFFLLSGAYSSTYGGLPRFNTYYPSNSIYMGRVYGRSIVKDEDTGLPKWATYNKEGGHTELNDIDLEQASKGKVISATYLNNYYLKLSDFKDRYDGEWTLLNNEDYEEIRKSEEGFQTQDGTPIIGLPELKKENGQFAIVLPKKSKRFNLNGSRIETIIFPFDVTEEPEILPDTFTVLVDENGEFMEQSPERIGYLSAFVLGEDGKVAPSTEYDQYTGAMTNLFQRDVLNPVAGVRITGENGMALNQETYTDFGGAYRLQMRFGCPGGAFQTITYLDAHMSYGMFNPRGLSSMPYWISFPAIDNCLGFIDPNTGISTANNEVNIVNVQVAISVLTGTATLWNAEISEDEPTAYHAEQSLEELFSVVNDYDGDGILDGTARGKINDEKFFEGSAEGNIYGVFLSGSPRGDGQPNFTRIMDVKGNAKAQGLVSIVNKEDLRNTDIYAFRESTGELITERIGIPKDEEKLRVIGGHGEGLTESGQFTFTFAIRSPEDMLSMHSKRHDGWEAWQADNKINPDLHSRQSDFIRSGEKIRIVAINRATGYMGSSLATMGGTSGGGDLTVYVPPLLLGPPNLKVWATRRYNPEGLLKDSDVVRNTISNEGAATTGDDLIEVHTEWLDANDMPLPDELQNRGFTGRLVKVVSDDGAFETKVTEFAINPGRHMQVMKFSEGTIGKAHFYLQVNGNVEEKENDFSTGVHEGVLVHRPNLYVPVKVPLYNEQETKLNAYLQKIAEAEDEAANGEQGEEEKFKEEPLFDWVYRPELSFSVVDLEVQEILREQEDEEGNTTVSLNVMEDDTPTISSTDDLIKVMFELAESEYDRITPLDGEQEYIFALGEQEFSITLTEHKNEEKEITFSNLEHLAEIEPEDYLSLRLYLNQDSQNVLWEFAFNFLTLFPAENSKLGEEYNTIEISADEAASSQSVNAYLTSANEGSSVLEVLEWSVEGEGSVSPKQSRGTNGVYSTLLTLSTKVDDEATVHAVFSGSEKTAYSTTYKITPGLAASIDIISEDGSTVIGGLGEVTWVLEVKDAYGNDVKDGTEVQVIATGLEVKGVTEVVGGKATVSFTGVAEAGNMSVDLIVDSAEYTGQINVHDVSLSYVNLVDVSVESVSQFTVQASSGYGSLEGLELDVAVHRGSLNVSRVSLGASNSAVVDYDSGHFRGFAQLSSKVVGTRAFITESFSVVDDDSYLESNILVTDGSGNIDLGNGNLLGYGNATNLHVATVPNDSVSSTLSNIFEPPIYALQDYSAELGLTQSGAILDLSSGIDASSQNVSLVSAELNKFNLSWLLGSDTGEAGFIEVPEHARTSNLTEAGINFWIKIPDLATHNEAATLVNWDDYGLNLQLNSDHTLSLIARQQNSNESVTHPIVMKSGQWHQVAAHFYNGEIKIGIDNQVVSKALPNSLVAANDESYALKVGLEGSPISEWQLTGLKIFDWQGEAKLTFTDGSFDQDAIADDQGKAQFGITARPALLAYTRTHEQQSLIAQLGNLIVPRAYAQSSDTACQDSYQPIDPSDEDAAIKRADQYMTMLLECFIKPHVEEARISYQTSEGIKEKTVALVKSQTLETVYAVLNQTKSNSIAVLNCLDASVTGSNGSAVGAACDFVTSMLAIGDLRDVVIQSWHYHLGHLTGTRDDYDELTAQLASVGLIASGSQLIPYVGQTIGVVATAFVASAKTVAKFLKKVGDAGQKAGDIIAQKLGIIINNPNTSFAQKKDELEVVVPLMEIGVSLTLVYEAEPELFSFLAHTLNSGQALDNMATWLERYLQQLNSELIALNDARFPAWVSLLIPEAYADITDIAKGKFVVQLRKLLDGIDYLPDVVDYKALAPKFNDSLDRFVKLVKDPNYVFKEVHNDMDVLRAFVTVGELGGENSVKHFSKHEGYTIGYTKAEFSEIEFVNAIADMPLTELSADARNGLAGLINSFSNSLGFKVTKGNISHVLAVADMLKGKKYKILDVEFVEDSLSMPSGTVFAGRRVDIKVEVTINGLKRIVSIEFKNWSSNTWNKSLTASMSKTPKKTGEAAEVAAKEVGQLYTDLLRYMKDGNAGQQWNFTPDVIEDGLTKELMEKKMIEHIEGLIDKEETALALEFGIDLDSDKISEEALKDWDDKIIELKKALNGEGPDGQKFVQIYAYDNIIKAVE